MAFPMFNHEKPETWVDHIEKFQMWLKSNGIDKPEQKRGLLISTLDEHTYRKLQDWMAPVHLSGFTYDDIVAKINHNIKPDINTLLLYKDFVSRKQGDGESAEAYVADLKKMAWGLGLDGKARKLVLHQFVCGLANAALQTALLADKDISLERALDAARGAERARPPPLPREEVGSNKRITCHRCGDQHFASQCPKPTASLRCKNCGKGGHLVAVCKALRRGGPVATSAPPA